MDFLMVNLRYLKIQPKGRFLWIFPPWVALGFFSFRVLRAVLKSLQGVKFLGDLRVLPPQGLAYTIGAKPGHLKNPISRSQN
jgi:hypothetical protein